MPEGHLGLAMKTEPCLALTSNSTSYLDKPECLVGSELGGRETACPKM